MPVHASMQAAAVDVTLMRNQQRSFRPHCRCRFRAMRSRESVFPVDVRPYIHANKCRYRCHVRLAHLLRV